MNNKQLTKAEEEVMQVLWDQKKAFVKDLITDLPEPKPAYNTVSTIIRILEKKGFVGHEAFGRSHRYFPVITKEEYTRFSMSRLLKSYFNGSAEKMLSFFIQEEKVSSEELENILKEINKNDSI